MITNGTLTKEEHEEFNQFVQELADQKVAIAKIHNKILGRLETYLVRLVFDAQGNVVDYLPYAKVFGKAEREQLGKLKPTKN